MNNKDLEYVNFTRCKFLIGYDFDYCDLDIFTSGFSSSTSFTQLKLFYVAVQSQLQIYYTQQIMNLLYAILLLRIILRKYKNLNVINI